MNKIVFVLCIVFPLSLAGCQKSGRGSSPLDSIDVNDLHEGMAGRLSDHGRPVEITVDEIRGDGLLIVDFHGQSWILYGMNVKDIVDGQDLTLKGKWRVMGTHLYGGKKCWKLKKESD